MKTYDLSKGRRGAAAPVKPGKTQITIRLDDDIIQWFVAQTDHAGGGNYQTMINDVLPSAVTSNPANGGHFKTGQ